MVFVVIAGTAGRYFSSAFDSVEVTEANTAVQGFATSVINVHKNWILQGRPSKVSIRSLDDFGNPANEWIFIMNEQGWPINVLDGNDKPDCTALWYALQKNDRLPFSGMAVRMMSNDLGQLEAPGVDNSRFNDINNSIWVCQNIVAQQLLFRYRLDTGKVELQ